jgi:hypothetical protein
VADEQVPGVAISGVVEQFRQHTVEGGVQHVEEPGDMRRGLLGGWRHHALSFPS